MLRALIFVSVFFQAHVDAQAQDALPDSVRKEFEAYVGNWTGTLDFDGQKSPAKWRVEWAPGKQCLVMHEVYEIGGQTNMLTALLAYDRIQKHVVNVGYRTDGGNRTLVYSDDLQSGKVSGDGPDGEDWRSDFTIVKHASEWVFKSKARSPEARDFEIRMTKTTR